MPEFGSLYQLKGALGAAEFCWHAASILRLIDYYLFNKPLAANQLIQLKLANMQTDIIWVFKDVWKLAIQEDMADLHQN